jgi:3' terminal RNA ribose 2'-O-methyltransferase Hen1
LDEKFPEWGESPYVSLTVSGTVRLQDLLTHLYVLIPVLDNEKHYWVAQDEIEKLLKRGEGWLPQHPEKDLIVSRYLKRQRHLTREALTRLPEDDSPSEEADVAPEEPQTTERAPSLHTQRLQIVLSAIQATGAKRVLNLGCGEGKLLRLFLAEKQFESILGMDVSWRSLETAKERMRIDELPERQRGRIELIQGSLTYRDQRLNGFDTAAIVEVIEHLDAARLATFERIVFEFARPRHVVLTTPNAEYNTVFETLPAGEFRHGDHRFEWKRAEFETWATGVAADALVGEGAGTASEAVCPRGQRRCPSPQSGERDHREGHVAHNGAGGSVGQYLCAAGCRRALHSRLSGVLLAGKLTCRSQTCAIPYLGK